jgi:hypothetical protein
MVAQAAPGLWGFGPACRAVRRRGPFVRSKASPPAFGFEAVPDRLRTRHVLDLERQLAIGRPARAHRLGTEHFDHAGTKVDEREPPWELHRIDRPRDNDTAILERQAEPRQRRGGVGESSRNSTP